MSMFEMAVKMKLRFNFRGLLSVEDLFDLDVQELDILYRELKKLEREQTGDSLIEENKTNETLELQIAIVKHIVLNKMDEIDRANQAAERKVKKQRLLAILEQKEMEEMQGMSRDDIQKMIEEL